MQAPMDGSSDAASVVPQYQPSSSNSSNNYLSLPENPFCDLTSINGSSSSLHTGLDFLPNEYPPRLNLPSHVCALRNRFERMNIGSHVQQRTDIHMQTNILRPPFFTDVYVQNFSTPHIGTSRSTSSVFGHGENQPTHSSVSTTFLSLAKSPRGSAKLKQKISENNPHITTKIFSLVEGLVYELIFNQFGSSFLQTLFESMADDYVEEMLKELLLGQERLKDACMHNFGNKAVMKLIRRLKSKYYQGWFASATSKYVISLTKSTFGHEVILECFNTFSPEYIQMLMKEVVANCFEVATDKGGCCILQSCMTFCDNHTICSLLIEISEHAVILSEHEYGNYVVQRAVGLVKEGFISAEILSRLEGHYVDMSMNKYASHVVEKCINEFPYDHAVRVVREFINSERFFNVLLNSYGNYVLQCAIKKFTGSILQELITCIDQYSTSLKSHPHAKGVIRTANARRDQLHLNNQIINAITRI